MEQIARDLDLDPVEFRLRHLIQEGDPMVNGQPWQSNGAKQVLARIAEHPHWKSRKQWIDRAARTASAAAWAWPSAAGSAGSSPPARRCG